MMHVINFVFEHGDTLKADTECKALIFFRINAAHFKYMRMHHTAAKDFNPAFTFTHSAAFATAFEACDIHFGTWFCEWEMMRSELDLCIFAEIGQTMVGGGESLQERAAEDYESAGFGMYSQRA